MPSRTRNLKVRMSTLSCLETAKRPSDCMRISLRSAALPQVRPVGLYRYYYYVNCPTYCTPHPHIALIASCPPQALQDWARGATHSSTVREHGLTGNTGVRGHIVCLLEAMDAFSYVCFRILSTFENVLHRALFFLFAWIRTRWIMRFPRFSSCASLTCISFVPGNNG